MRRFLTFLKYTILSILVLVIIVPVALYIPAVQTFVCNQAVAYLNDYNDQMSFSIGKIRIGFPLKLKVYDVEVVSKSDSTLLASVGKLETSLDGVPPGSDYFFVKRLKVEDIKLGFDTLTQSLLLKGSVANIDVRNIYLNLDQSKVEVGKIVVDHPDMSVALGPSEPDSIDDDTPFEWTISLNNVLAVGGNVRFDMSDISLDDAVGFVAIEHYLDYNHLNLKNLHVGVDNFVYQQDHIDCKVSSLTVEEENSQLYVDHLQTRFLMDSTLIKAEEIDLKMPESAVSGDFVIDLTLLDSLGTGYMTSALKGYLASHDLISIASPYLPEIKTYWPEKSTSFKANGYLTRDTFQLDEFALRVPDHVDIMVEGFGVSPFSKEHRKVNATARCKLQDADFLLSSFVAKPEDRSYFLPKDLFAEVDGSYRKTYAQAEMLIKQEDNIILEGLAKYNIDSESYDVNVKTDRLKLTEFVPSSGIEGLTTHVNAKGRHFDFPGKYTLADVQLQLDTLYYLNKRGERDSLYDVTADAKLERGRYFAEITSGHPYLMLDTQLEGDFDRKKVSLQGYIDLQKLDLLHMPQVVSFDEGQIRMESDVMLSYDYGDNAYADLLVHNLTYEDGERIHPFDEIDLRFSSSKRHLEARFESGDALLSLDADLGLASIVTSIDKVMEEVDRQIEATSVDLPSLQKLLPGFNAEFDIKRDNSFYPIAKAFGYRFSQVKSNISNDSIFSLQLRVLGLNTIDQHVDTVQIRFRPERDKNVYDYKFHASYAAPKAKDSFVMDGSGSVYTDSITACFEYENGKYIKMYDVDASVALSYDTVRLKFTDDPLIYATRFNVNPDNFSQVSQFKNLESEALGINADLKLNNEKGLNVNLLTNKKDSVGNDVHLEIRNLDIANISRILQLGLDAGGLVNAHADIELLPRSMFANLKTNVSRFHIGDYKADTLLFNGLASNDLGDMRMAGKLTIDQIVKLNVLASMADSVDVNVGIYDFPLPLVNGFLPNNIQLKGETSGELAIQGKDFETSAFNGFIKMHDAMVNYADCNADVRFPEDTISIRRNRIRLRDYQLLCANKNPITLRGSVDFSQQIADPDINLIIKGDKVQVFNNQKRKNKLQYIHGTLPAKVDMTVKGKVSNLDIRGNVSALEGTNLVYYLEDDPLSSACKVDELVEFVRFREVDRILPDHLDRPWKQSAKDEGIKVDLKMNIATNAKVYVNLPTNEKDHVTLIGGGSLQLDCASDGSLLMSGLYDITGGEVHYKLPMIPMTKDFSLNESSWISWNGDVADPNINLIAVERVKSTVNDQAGARVVNFDVAINIAGTLNRLDITFDCSAPEDGSIASELASLNAEERSKQALLLLIAQTYMGPGNASSMGLASANAALNSLLNKELESLLSNKFKNTDINLGIDTYDSDGTVRTDYSVKVSQRLFDDRVRVTLGGKISSGDNADEGQRDAMINDASLEYLTKEDGSSYVRLFRKTNYQNILEGEVVETGIGYVQQRSGFRFRNLLIPNNKKREEELKRQIEVLQDAERHADMGMRRRNIPEGGRPIPANNDSVNINANDSIEKKDSITVIANAGDSIAVGSLQHDK